VEELFAKGGFTNPQSDQIIDTLFELMKQSLQDGEDVIIHGFGKFSVKEKYRRIGWNPQTGKPLVLPSRNVVRFKCSDAVCMHSAEIDALFRLTASFDCP
jgi:integration host factor subunit alpha